MKKEINMDKIKKENIKVNKFIQEFKTFGLIHII